MRLGTADAEPIGATPLRRVKVPKGPQVFLFRLDGYEELSVTETIKRHGQRVRVTLQKAAVLDIVAADEASHGAALSIDGVESGWVPQRLQVRPGRHLLVVSREGFESTETWVSVERGQVVPTTVRVGEPEVGGLHVVADVPGAEVWLAGELRGTVPFTWEDAPPGKIPVEVRAPGRVPYRTTARVTSGKRSVVKASFLGPRGGLRITTNAFGAHVWLDGAHLGVAPVGSDSLEPGDHLLEVLLSGYQPLTETVSVEAGQRRVLGLVLVPRAGEPMGSIVVEASPPGTRVSIDGRDYGPVPVVAVGLPPGERVVTLQADGHTQLTTRCTVAAAQGCKVGAALVRDGERLVVRSSTPGATLYADDALLGPLPYEGGIPVGVHRLEARAPNHTTWTQDVTVTAGSNAGVYEAKLQIRRPELRGVFVHSADVLPPGRMTADVSVGWVHLVEARFDVGVLPYLDAGVGLRSFGRLTELEVRARGSYRFTPLLSAGVQLHAGGGFGPNDADTGFVLMELLGSVHVEPHVAITLLLATDIYSDFYAYSETDSDVPAASDERQNTVGFRFGGNVEVALTEQWNVWGGIEWTATRSQSRRVLGDLFASGSEAANLWFRLGAAMKF